MEFRHKSLVIISLSVVLGSGIFLLGSGLGEGQPVGNTTEPENSSTGEDSGLVYGSAHEHALFYVSVNGTELNFSDRKFQLNSRYVHLENGRSHIVHKHAEGVTWNHFLDTVNISVTDNDGEDFCISIHEENYCGEGEISVTGGNLNSSIDQGDKLILALGENASKKAGELRDEELPDDFVPRKPGYGA